MTNKYNGKAFSVLGDSISTLSGYNPSGYNVFYQNEICEKAGIFEQSDTWWGMVIDALGGTLMANNSFSGSWVSKMPNTADLFPSACCEGRTGRLHNPLSPDVVMVFMGYNDWAFGASLKGSTEESFEGAYDLMLKRIKYNYPNAEVWCLTLGISYMSSNKNLSCKRYSGGWHMQDFNKIIRACASKNDCKVIDLYALRMPYDSIDLTHPNKSGMKTIANMVLKSLDKK